MSTSISSRTWNILGNIVKILTDFKPFQRPTWFRARDYRNQRINKKNV